MKKAFDKLFFIANSDIMNGDILTYKEPFLVYGNYQPLSGFTEIVEYGQRITKMFKVLLDASIWQGNIAEGDVAYLENVTPESDTFYGENANYMVVSVRIQHLKIAVYFEKMQK